MTRYYRWVPWIMELAKKISGNKEEYLIEKSNEVNRKLNNPSLLSDGDGGVDPFSFFYFLAQKNTENRVLPLFRIVHDVFGLTEKFPESPQSKIIIPTPPPPAIVLFHDRKAFNTKLLWKLFHSSVGNGNDIDQQEFSEVLKLTKMGVKELTQLLFIINPRCFLPIDEKLSLLGKNFSDLERKIHHGGYHAYKSTIIEICQSFPGCDYFEINQFLYSQNREYRINNESTFFQVGTDVYNNGSDYWELNKEYPNIQKTFKENDFVYVGGARSNERLYHVADPIPGDIVLVRKGKNQGKGIGVVYQNEYAEAGGYHEDAVIRVIWINKIPSVLSYPASVQYGFSRAGRATIFAFKSSDTYRRSVEIIENLVGEEITSGSINFEKKKRNDVDHTLNTILGSTSNRVGNSVFNHKMSLEFNHRAGINLLINP